MDTPIWWAIWIGPQQQHQPGGTVQGCAMDYPVSDFCQTDPLVTMRDITLRNITSTGALLPAGVILCNATNPCKNFVFEDVNMRSPLWDAIGIGYINHFSEGVSIRSFPDPRFKPEGYYDDPKNRVLEKTWDLRALFNAEYMMELLTKAMFGIDITKEQAKLISA